MSIGGRTERDTDVQVRSIRSQPSWILRSDSAEAAITQLGAHMAPVTFETASTKPIQPYAFSPWQGDRNSTPSGGSERILRGDFFCLPFGRGPAPRGELHPPHGVTSSEAWTLLESSRKDGESRLSIAIETTERPGRVVRCFSLRDGHNAVYGSTMIEGFAGLATFGHHAMIALPAQERALLVSTSPIRLGMTFPGVFAYPVEGNYQSLYAGRRFTDLARVSSIFRGASPADCSAFPCRPGFTDLLQIAQRPRRGEPAWVVAVNTEANYLWYSLKDPALLPSTIFWMENRGRHGAPWSGRNCSLGLEDVCSYFDQGILASSRGNDFSRCGISTSRRLREGEPLIVPYVQGVARTPSGFGRVKRVRFSEGKVTFSDVRGKSVSTVIDHEWVWRGDSALRGLSAS